MPEVKYTFSAQDNTGSTINRIVRRVNSLANMSINMRVGVRAVGISQVENQLRGLSKDVSVTVTPTVNTSQVQSQIDALKSPTITVTPTVDVSKIQGQLDAIYAPGVTVTPVVDLAKIQTQLDSVAAPDVTVTPSVDTGQVQSQLDALETDPNVNIVPTVDTAQVQSQLDALETDPNVNIVPTVDTTQIQTQLDAIYAPGVNVTPSVDTAQVQSQLDALETDPSVNIVPTVDTAQVQSQLDALETDPNVNIVPTVDTSQIQTQLDAIYAPGVNVTPSVDTTQIQTQLDAIDAPSITVTPTIDVSGIQSELDAVDPPSITVTPVVDTTQIQTQLDAIYAPGVNITPSVDTTQIQTQLDAIDAPSITVTPTIDVSGIQSELDAIDPPSITVTPVVDTTQIQAQLDAIYAPGVNITPSVDTTQIQTQLDAIDAPSVSVTPTIDVSGIQSELDAVDAPSITVIPTVDVSQVQSQLDGIYAPSVNVTPNVDTAKVVSDLGGITTAAVNVTPTVNTAAAELAIQGLKGGTVEVTPTIPEGALTSIGEQISAAVSAALPGSLGTALGVGTLVAAPISAAAFTAAKALEIDAVIDQVAGAAGIAEDSEERQRLETLLFKEGTGVSEFSQAQFALMAEMFFRNSVSLETLEAGALKEAATLAEALVQAGGIPAQVAPLAVNIITDLMQQWGITDPSELKGIGDMVAGVTLSSKFDIRDVGMGIAMAGGSSAAMGMSMEDFLTMLAVAAPYGAGGSDVGTSIKSMQNFLARPAGPALGLLYEAGLLHDVEYKTTGGGLRGGVTQLYDPTTHQKRDEGEFMAMARAAINAATGTEAQKRQDVTKMFGRVGADYFLGGAELTDAQWQAIIRRAEVPSNLKIWEQYGLLHSQEYAPTQKTVVGGTTFMFDEETGAMREWGEVLQDLQDAVKDMTDAERSEFLTGVFGTDASRAAAAGSVAGMEGFMEVQAAILATDVEVLAEIKRGNAAAEWRILIGKIETVAARLGRPLAVVIQTTLERANETADFVLASQEEQREILRKMEQDRRSGKDMEGFSFSPDGELGAGQIVLADVVSRMGESLQVWAGKQIGNVGEEEEKRWKEIRRERSIAIVGEADKKYRFDQISDQFMKDIQGGIAIRNMQLARGVADPISLDQIMMDALTNAKERVTELGIFDTQESIDIGMHLIEDFQKLVSTFTTVAQRLPAPGTMPGGPESTTMGRPATTMDMASTTALPEGMGKYTVVSGDTLREIAHRNNINLDQMLLANPQITDPDRIDVGQQLNIPHALFGLDAQGAEGLASFVNVLTGTVDTQTEASVGLVAKVTELDLSEVEGESIDIYGNIVVDGGMGGGNGSRRTRQDTETQQSNTVRDTTYRATRQVMGGSGGSTRGMLAR